MICSEKDASRYAPNVSFATFNASCFFMLPVMNTAEFCGVYQFCEIPRRMLRACSTVVRVKIAGYTPESCFHGAAEKTRESMPLFINVDGNCACCCTSALRADNSAFSELSVKTGLNASFERYVIAEENCAGETVILYREESALHSAETAGSPAEFSGAAYLKRRE